MLIFMHSSKKGGHICFAAVCLSVRRSVRQQFSFTFFAEAAHTEMKFIMYISRSSTVFDTIKEFVTELCLLDFGQFQLFAFYAELQHCTP